jgi:hypothetical protein
MRPVRRANFMVNSSAVRLAGDINAKVTDKASLDGLLAKIKAELTKLGPILATGPGACAARASC